MIIFVYKYILPILSDLQHPFSFMYNSSIVLAVQEENWYKWYVSVGLILSTSCCVLKTQNEQDRTTIQTHNN